MEIVGKTLRFFPTKGLQSAARIICPPQTDKFHTGSLRGIFSYAHVARENDFISLPPAGGKLCEAFLTHCKAPSAKRVPWFWGEMCRASGAPAHRFADLPGGVQQLPDVDQIVVPIGGGGLITGISYAMKHLKPGVRIVGVMPEGSAVYAASRAAGKLVTLDSCASIADAVVRKTGEPYLYPYIEEYVDDIVTVSEDELRKAIKLACLYAKLTLEGAASLALAAVTSGKCALTEQAVLLCSGGNIDGSVLLSCLQG